MKKKFSFFTILLVVTVGLFAFFKSIGKELFVSNQAPLPEPKILRANPEALKKQVELLTSSSRPRNHTNADVLEKLSRAIQAEFSKLGIQNERQSFQANGKTYWNVVASIGPNEAPAIVFGAHYDVAGDQDGADDNASGVAGVLELARLLAEQKPPLKNKIILVAYCLEEPPFFGSNQMGSAVHAKSLKKEKIQVKLMVSLEMIGYFDRTEGSQNFPTAALKHIYPNRGDFIAVVGEIKAIAMVRKIKNLMSRNSKIDVQSISAPRSLLGVDLSDHRSYWEEGFPAVMVTDTAFFRNPNYHTNRDTIGTLDFKMMSEVVNGVFGVVVGFD